jgi:Ni/Fe-hydrogenase 1 B-type cytochrome subunit
MARPRSAPLRHPLSFRVLHELIIWSILALLITGFYIHRPFIEGGGFLMSMSRGVHNLFAIILIVSAVSRVASMFIGRDRDWRSFVPSGSDLKKLGKTINYYAYFRDEPELTKKYNPLQMLTYCLVFVLVLFQIIAGLSLKYVFAFGWFNFGLFNNAIEVRMAHYVVAWLFIMFIMLHVYLAIREKFHEIREMHLYGRETAEEPETAGETRR